MASFQLCPLASPAVAPQAHVFGSVQVAGLKLWTWGGSVVSSVVGSAVGSAVGSVVGAVVGSVVGAVVGSVVGSVVGTVVGSVVGTVVGSVVGAVVVSATEFVVATVAEVDDSLAVSFVGNVISINTVSTTMTMALILPFINLCRMLCHCSMGTINKATRAAIIHAKLGMDDKAINARKPTIIQRMIFFTRVIICFIICFSFLFIIIWTASGKYH